MSLPLSRYVNIVSSVGAPTSFLGRALTLRLFTINPLVPPLTVLEFTNAADVGTYFGTTSGEYLRAIVYFGFISKNVTAPALISYSRWVSTAQDPAVYGGDTQVQALATYTPITAGSIGITVSGGAGGSNQFTAINFSTATTLGGAAPSVASLLQTAIRTYTGGGAMFTGATVTYDAVRGAFDLAMGTASPGAVLTIQPGATGQDISALLGWTGDPTAVFAAGAAVETLTQTLDNSVGVSNNFGSFNFIPVLSSSQLVEVATWTDASDFGYMHLVGMLSANVSSYMPLIAGLGGTGVTLNNTSGTYPELLPGMILAATDYVLPNAAQNYMFQQDGSFPAEVTATSVANTMDGLGVNYMGQVQQAGVAVNFYQRGVLTGISTDATDMNVYANEMWLKDAAAVALVNLLVGVNQVPANNTGRGMILSTLQPIIDQALLNGTISVGKPLTSTQILYISQITNDTNAWQQVKTIGYWVNCIIIPDPDHAGQFIAEYTLVYSKDDIIRFVSGRDVLI
jgi:hypothetical protein